MSISQTLRPKIVLQGIDTLFGFTIPQSKYIAKKISNGKYCDSIVETKTEEIDSLKILNGTSEEKILLLQEKQGNLNTIISNKDTEITGLNSDVGNYKKKLKNQKRVSILIILLLSTFAVIK